MIALLDTTALSAAMRRDEGMTSFLRSLRPGDVATAPPAVAEIEYGIRRLVPGSRRRELLEAERLRVLSAIAVLEWTPDASGEFGEIKAHLEKSGTPIDDFDVAIAAVARSHGAEVITANLVHFARVPNLRARHWL